MRNILQKRETTGVMKDNVSSKSNLLGPHITATGNIASNTYICFRKTNVKGKRKEHAKRDTNNNDEEKEKRETKQKHTT